MAEAKTDEQLKAEEEAKKQAELEAKKSQVVIEDGMVKLSETDYNNLVKMKDDMLDYKSALRETKKQLEDILATQQKAKEENLKQQEKYKELYEEEQKKNIDMQTKFTDQYISNALQVAALSAGISKIEYIKLIDKSKVKLDDDTNEIIGVDELVESFKKDNPELFKSDDKMPPVDTTKGGSSSGVISDDDLRKMSGKELMRIKKEDPALWDRYVKVATHGRK